MSSLIPDPFALVLLLTLAVVVPAVGVWDFRRFQDRYGAGHEHARRGFYAWTIALEWSLALGFLAWWLGTGGGLAPLRLVPAVAGWQWAVVAAGLAALAATVLHMVSVVRSPGKLAEVRDQAGDLGAVAPRTPAERRLWVAVCLTAGICEELLYRGLLLGVLAAAAGTWTAVVLSSLVFGLGHAYQGWRGMGTSAAVGLVLALLAVGTGSLFLPMLLHAVVDLTSGHMLGRAFHGAAPRLDA